jgi:acetolactate synthase-1/2/3 large subunit
MNGAESLVRTLVAGGVDVCFTNPGTSEMHFVAALDKVPGMRCVLGLFEGIVTGAADGYFRMKGTPASTLLHLGPGLANGLANLHNAKKANSGIVNIVGQHATYHIEYNAPLTSDIEGLARPMSSWVRTSPDAKSVAADGAAAIAAAAGAPPQIATLILPADTAWNQADGVAQVPAGSQGESYSAAAVENTARLLRSGEPTLLLMTGSAVTEKGLALAAQIAGKTGCKVMGPLASPRMARGRGRFSIERVPYVVEQALAALKGFRHIVLLEANEPVAFFAYPNKPSLLKPEGCDVHRMTASGGKFGRGAGGVGLGGRRQARRCEAAGRGRSRQADRRVESCVDRAGDRGSGP